MRDDPVSNNVYPLLNVTLAIPPSANSRLIIQKGNRRMVNSPKYAEWKENAKRTIWREIGTASDPKKDPGKLIEYSGYHVRIWVKFTTDKRRRKDLDNIVKPCLDAITDAGIWLDDKEVDYLSVERIKDDDDRMDAGFIAIQVETTAAWEDPF